MSFARRIATMAVLGFLSPLVPQVAGAASPFPPNWIGGHVTGNVTLGADAPGPTYYLYGDLTIDPGATLTIAPGVGIIALAKSDYFASGSIVDRAEVVVAGSLLAVGTPTAHIDMRSTSDPTLESSRDDWGGITVLNGGTATLDYVDVQAARNAMSLAGTANASHTSNAHCSSTGVDLEVTGVLNAANLSIDDAVGSGIFGYGSVTATATTITNCSIGLNIGNAHAILVGCSLVRNCGGVSAYGSVVVMRACTLQGSGACGGNGIYLAGSTIDTDVPDPTSPSPSEIKAFTGAAIYWGNGNSGVLRNLLIHDNGSNALDGAPADLEYVTVARNGGGIAQAGDLKNSIVVLNGRGIATSQHVEFSDVWGNSGFNFLNLPPTFGPSVAVFDPALAAPASGDFHLSGGSLFLDFGSSGGQIGAYGPGPGGPVATSGATLISTDASESRVRLEWLTQGASGSSALVCRATPSGDWVGIGQASISANDRIVYEDADVVPGDTYRYGIGVRTLAGVTVDGQVTVAVPAIPRLAIASTAVLRGGRPRMALAVPHSGTIRVDFITASGRMVGHQSVAAEAAGRLEVALPAEVLAAHGILFVRASEGQEVASGKLVIL